MHTQSFNFSKQRAFFGGHNLFIECAVPTDKGFLIGGDKK